jgi:uncharacterized protein
MELAGRTAILTGASGGIGKAIARALHARGAELVVTARRTEVLEELQRELAGRVEPIVADLSNRDEVERLAGRAAADADVLVANAALPGSGAVDDFTVDQIDRTIEVNLRAPMRLAREMVPALKERGAGHLVFISSLSGKVASPGSAIYSSTKYGVRGFAAGLRQDLHGTGVGVTVVFPGFVSDAGLFAESGAELPRGVGTRTPEQVADAVVRGIEREKAEIDVAPMAMRAGTLVGALAPGLSERIQRRFGAELSARIAEGQKPKR